MRQWFQMILKSEMHGSFSNGISHFHLSHKSVIGRGRPNYGSAASLTFKEVLYIWRFEQQPWADEKFSVTSMKMHRSPKQH